MSSLTNYIYEVGEKDHGENLHKWPQWLEHMLREAAFGDQRCPMCEETGPDVELASSDYFRFKKTCKDCGFHWHKE